jgi:ribosome biogenesis GTPase A
LYSTLLHSLSDVKLFVCPSYVNAVPTHSSPIPTINTEERTLSVTLVIRAAERSSIPLIQEQLLLLFQQHSLSVSSLDCIRYSETQKQSTLYIVRGKSFETILGMRPTNLWLTLHCYGCFMWLSLSSVTTTSNRVCSFVIRRSTTTRTLTPQHDVRWRSVQQSHVTTVTTTVRTPSTRNNVGIRTIRTSSTTSSTDLAARGNNAAYDDDDDDELLSSGYKRPTVNWYPGHIAKAERQLSETLKAVDVVVEVRDARACKATSHERVAEWCAGTPRIVVLTHMDLIPTASMTSWKRSYDYFGAGKWDGQVNAQIRNQALQNQSERNKHSTTTTTTANTKVAAISATTTTTTTNQKPNAASHSVSHVEDVLFVDAKNGQGIHALHRAIFKAGAHVQERRAKRGLKERALRVGIIGYPNVGKSALINRILGRKRAKTENTPGVTRSLQWIRVKADDSKTSSKKKDFELLDSPGVIPAKMIDQSDAILLAACNCIGDAAYDNQAVAAYLFEWLQALHRMGKGPMAAPDFRTKCKERYGFDPIGHEELTGEDMVFKVADDFCRGSPEDAARKMLQDFRTGRLGPICLQLAPESEDDDGQRKVPLASEHRKSEQREKLAREDGRIARAEAALETAQKKGLQLPPMIQGRKESEVGKGLFDGW